MSAILVQERFLLSTVLGRIHISVGIGIHVWDDGSWIRRPAITLIAVFVLC
jgi:hypothetical protein